MYNDNLYGNEIPMEERQAVFQECINDIIQEATELGFYNGSNDEYFVEDTLLEDGTFSSKGTVMRLGKQGKMNWFKSRAAIAYARANKDALYTQLVKVSRRRKQLIAAINKKYNSKSTARAKQLMKHTKGTTNVFSKPTPRTGTGKKK